MSRLLLKKRSGVKIGKAYFLAVHTSYPLSSIEIYNDKIKVGRKEVKKKDIVAIKSETFCLIRIIHKNKSLPKYIAFWKYFGHKEFLNKLKKWGYPVK